MNLEGILSVTGKSGLFQLSARTKAGIIVRDLETGKKFPIHSTHKVSALNDISIYGLSEDKPLGEIYDALYKAGNGEKVEVDLKDVVTLRTKLAEVFPEYDEDRVYSSDLKKLFKWYNVLVDTGMFETEVDDAEKAEVDAKDQVNDDDGKETEGKKKAVGKKKTEDKD